MTEDELIERLADKEHASWSRWQQYLHSLCERREDGALIISASRVARWEREIVAPYADLSEREKQYDRDEVAHILPIIRQYVASQAPVSSIVSLWQTCPKCNGQKHVVTPPWVAGDIRTYSAADTKSYPCPVCDGRGLVPVPMAGGTR